MQIVIKIMTVSTQINFWTQDVRFAFIHHFVMCLIGIYGSDHERHSMKCKLTLLASFTLHIFKMLTEMCVASGRYKLNIG